MTEYFERNGERYIRQIIETKVSDLGLPFPVPPITAEPPPPIGKLLTPHSVTNGAVKLTGVGPDNLILYSNDFTRDTPEVPLLMLMADKSKVNIAAWVLDHNTDTNFTNAQILKYFADDRNWATVLGLKNVPPAVQGSTRKLVRPANGDIDATTVADAPGVDEIIKAAHRCTAEKPLLVFVGGQCTTPASAYLKDKTIAPKMIIFHTAGWVDGKTGSYNLGDEWSAYICMKRLKYVVGNIQTPGNPYWWTGKNMGLTKAMVDSIPDGHPTVKLFKRWFVENFPVEGMADGGPVLWWLDNSLWKGVQRRREDGTTTSGEDYDYLFIPNHDWPKYGPTLVNKFKELLGIVPPVVIPPIGNTVSPANAKQAIESASNTTIRIGPGTYSGAPINVPVGVSIECDGTVFIPTAAGTESGGQKVGVLNYNSGSKVNGNQYIKGAVFDGRNVGYSGIMVYNRDNVTIENCQFKDFNFNGAWISTSTGSTVKGNDFYNTGWSDNRYLSGALNIFAVTNLTIDGNKFRSDKNNKGTGIEALWKESTLTNLKIVNNEFRLSHHNPWNNGTSKNFSIELHDTHYRGMEIAYNDFGNEMSLASHKPGDGSKTLIHHNTGNLGGDTYFCETVADDFLIEDNIVSNAQMFAANFQANSVWKNWVIRNNKLLNSPGVPSWGGAILVGPLGIKNVILENNVFPSPVIKYMGVTGGVIMR